MKGMSASKQERLKKIQQVKTIPAPIGGLNARDALSAMPPTDAYGLINWIPQNYGVASRKGYSEWATNLTGGTVGSVCTWFGLATDPPTCNFGWPTTMPGKSLAILMTAFGILRLHGSWSMSSVHQ
jgi:hypothetical protein